MALAAISDGETILIETIFESRIAHIPELKKMGAIITSSADKLKSTVFGVGKLKGADVEAADLRGGAALIIAGLAAEGTTNVAKAEFVMRGYENIEYALQSLGADIELI